MANVQVWNNKKRTADRHCPCGSWKAHWINRTGQSWPKICSVIRCSSRPTLGAHIISKGVSGECIAPMCESCNKSQEPFRLKSQAKYTDAIANALCR